MPPISSSLPNMHAELGLKESAVFLLTERTKRAIEQAGYGIQGEKGRGGFGATFEVTRLQLGGKAIVKVMLDPTDQHHLKAFKREVRILASEHVPKDLVPGYLTHDDQPGIQPFVVMDYIHGHEIQSYVSKPHSLPLERRIEIVEKLFRAYERLHDCNLVHGDPSPRNTLVESGDRIRLIDYGSACRLSQGYGTVGTVSFKGITPGYGDDEILINGKRPDRWTDLYAAAAIAVRVLTDQDLPAELAPPAEIKEMNRILVAAEVPAGVRQIVTKARRKRDETLELDPQVYKTAGAAADAIQKWRRDRNQSQQRRKQLTTMLLTVLLVGAIGGLGWWKWSEERQLGDSRLLASLESKAEKLPNANHSGVARFIDQANEEKSSVSAKIRLLTRALGASRDIEWAESILDPLRKVLTESPWLDVRAVQEQKDKLVQQFKVLKEAVTAGETDNLQTQVAAMHSALAVLAKSNAEASPAEQSRIEFDRLMNSVDKKLTEKDGYLQITRSDRDAAQRLLDNGQWNEARLQFGSCSQRLVGWLKDNETTAQREVRQRGDQESLAAAELQKEALKADVARVQKILTEKTQQITELTTQISALTKERLEDAKKLTEAMAKLSTEQEARKTSDGKVAGLESTNSKLTADNSQLRADSREFVLLKPKHEKVVSDLSTATAELASTQKQVKELLKVAEMGGTDAARKAQEIRDLVIKVEAINTDDLKQTNAVYDEVRQRYARIEGERKELLKRFQPSAPSVVAKDKELAAAGEQLESTFVKVDQAHNRLFETYEQRIGVQQQELKRLTVEEKLLETVSEVVAVRNAIKDLQQQQKAFAPGSARAKGTGTKMSLSEILAANPISNPFLSKGFKTGIKVVSIPAGTFLMGSPASEAKRQSDEGPQHTNQISAFEMGIYPVTQEQYQRVMGTNPSWFSATGGGKDKVKGLDTTQFPVDSTAWYDAIEFCIKASELDGLSPYYGMTNIQRANGSIQSATVTILGGNGWRLPTEAEREYAARWTTTTPFFFGSSLNGDHANVDGNAPYGTTTKGKYLERTTTVGSYSPNKFGLFDMSGQVWEWCDDVYDSAVYASRKGTTKDPRVTTGSEYRVLRGGSWYGDAWSARSAFRNRGTPVLRLNNFGFRVVR